MTDAPRTLGSAAPGTEAPTIGDRRPTLPVRPDPAPAGVGAPLPLGVRPGTPAEVVGDGLAVDPHREAAPGTAGDPLPAHARADAPVWTRRGLRRGVIVAGVVIVAAAVLGFALDALVLSDPVQAAGMVQPDSTAQLNFTATAPVGVVAVQPGQHVRRGQLLATQDTKPLEAKLYSQKAELAADQAKLAQVQAGATAPRAQELGAQVQAAQTALADAESEQASAAALVGSDQQIESTTCATAGSSSVPCLTATRQTAQDANALTTAEGASATAASGLAVAQDAQYAGLHPYTAADVAAAQATVAADQAAVTVTDNAIGQAELRAPFAGIVGQVNGTEGEIASSQGVKQSSAQAGVPSSGGSGIAFFPQAPQGTTQSTPQYASMLTVESLATRIVAQVGETQLASVHVGQRAQVTMPAVPGSRYTAVVRAVSPTAVEQGGKPSYLVDLVLVGRGGATRSDAATGRAGLTADVSF